MAVLKTQLGLAKALALAFTPERLQNPGQSGFAKQKNCGEVKWSLGQVINHQSDKKLDHNLHNVH